MSRGMEWNRRQKDKQMIKKLKHIVRMRVSIHLLLSPAALSPPTGDIREIREIFFYLLLLAGPSKEGLNR